MGRAMERCTMQWSMSTQSASSLLLTVRSTLLVAIKWFCNLWFMKGAHNTLLTSVEALPQQLAQPMEQLIEGAAHLRTHAHVHLYVCTYLLAYKLTHVRMGAHAGANMITDAAADIGAHMVTDILGGARNLRKRASSVFKFAGKRQLAELLQRSMQ